MPGVVRGDQVYVQSENMREVYIQKLTEFAGPDTKAVWEKKIIAAEQMKPESETKKAGKKNIDLSVNSTERNTLAEQQPHRKKIAFFVQVGLAIQYRDEMIRKLQSVLEIFKDSREKVELIWIGDKEHDAFLKKYDCAFADRYDAIRVNFRKENWGLYLDRSEISVSEVVSMCDAYYGTCRNKNINFY